MKTEVIMLKKRILALAVMGAMLCGLGVSVSAAHYESGWGIDTVLDQTFAEDFIPVTPAAGKNDSEIKTLSDGIRYQRYWSNVSMEKTEADGRADVFQQSFPSDASPGDNTVYFDLPEEQDVKPGDIITISMDYKHNIGNGVDTPGKSYQLKMGLLNDGKSVKIPNYNIVDNSNQYLTWASGSEIAETFMQMGNRANGETTLALGHYTRGVVIDNNRWYHIKVMIETGAEGVDQTVTLTAAAPDGGNIAYTKDNDASRTELSEGKTVVMRTTVDADSTDAAVTKYTKLSGLKVWTGPVSPSETVETFIDNVTVTLEHDTNVLVSDLKKTIADVDFEGAAEGDVIQKSGSLVEIPDAANAGRISRAYEWVNAGFNAKIVETNTETGKVFQHKPDAGDYTWEKAMLKVEPLNGAVPLHAGDELHMSFDYFFDATALQKPNVQKISILFNDLQSMGYLRQMTPTDMASKPGAELLAITNGVIRILNPWIAEPALITLADKTWYNVKMIVKTVDRSADGSFTLQGETFRNSQTLTTIVSDNKGNRWEFCGIFDTNFEGTELNADTFYEEAATEGRGINRLEEFKNITLNLYRYENTTTMLDNIKVEVVTPGFEGSGPAVPDIAQTKFIPGEMLDLSVLAADVSYVNADAIPDVNLFYAEYDDGGTLVNVQKIPWDIQKAEPFHEVQIQTSANAQKIKVLLLDKSDIAPNIKSLDLTAS